MAGAFGSAAVLVSAASFALFTSQAVGQQDAFAAGTVVLAGQPKTCTIGPLEPGDSTTGYPNNLGSQQWPPCVYTLQYSGSLPAYVALNVTVDSVANPASDVCSGIQGVISSCNPLYNPGNVNSASDMNAGNPNSPINGLSLLVCGAQPLSVFPGVGLDPSSECVGRGPYGIAYGAGTDQTITYPDAYAYNGTSSPAAVDVCGAPSAQRVARSSPNT